VVPLALVCRACPLAVACALAAGSCLLPQPALAQHLLSRVRTAPLLVRVSDTSDVPVPSAEVFVQRRDSTAPTSVPKADDSRYRVEALPAGDWLITVTAPGYAAVTHEVHSTGTSVLEVAVQLAPAQFAEQVTVEATARLDETTLRMPATLHETPRSVSVIDSDRMRDQNFRGVNDALAYVPGMSVNSYRQGGYHFYSRGYRMLPDDTRVDGFAGVNAGGGFGASLFGVEQAVMLRGPAGLLYGSAGSPGGLINLVTKKPMDQRQTSVDLRMGGYAGNGVGLGDRGTFSTDIDATGPLTRDGRVLYRALATVENASYFTAGVEDRNRYLSGSLTFRLDRAGRYALTPLVQYMRATRPAGGGIVISPSTSLTTNDGSVGPVNTADLTPLDVNFSSGGRVDDTLMSGLDLRARPTDRTTVNAAYRFIGFDTDIDQFAPQVNNAQLVATSTVSRVHSRSVTERRTHSTDINGSHELRGAGGWKSLTQVGMQARWADSRGTTPAGAVPGPQSPIDIYTGQAPPLVANYPSLVTGAWTMNAYWNTYVQNRTSLADGRWVATLGLGYGENRVADGPARRSDVMPNAALVFNATSRLALYGSYATSYNPTDPAAEDITGQRNAFAPTTGRNAETGVKFDLADRRASLTLSVFDNEVSNGLVQSGPADLNPNGNRYFIEAGTRQSRGVELSADVQPLRDLRVMGSVSYLDAVYTGQGPASAAATLAIPGSRAEKSPEWSYSLWSRYDRSEGRLAGFGAGLGVVWQDTRFGGNGARTPSAPDPLLFPSFMRLDASLTYRLSDRVDLGLNIENVTDEIIFVSGTVGSSLEIAAPRTVTFRIGYRLP
jgi:iron complex outermembrane receptor protein